MLPDLAGGKKGKRTGSLNKTGKGGKKRGNSAPKKKKKKIPLAGRGKAERSRPPDWSQVPQGS